MAVSSGSIGGASADAGTEYGRAVGAYAIAFGLAGEPLLEFGPSGVDAQVASVAYQTDDEPDDVRVRFSSGQTCFVQAKRTLAFDEQFRRAVDQWVKAALAGLDPHDHVAVVAGSLSGPLRTLSAVLDMIRAPEYGGLTDEQTRVFKRLDGLLADLSVDQKRRLLTAAHIVLLDVEKPTGSHAAAGRMALASVVGEGETSNAWTHLLALAGAASRDRQGYDLDGWLTQLARHARLRDDGGATLVRRNQVRGRYLDHLRTFGRSVDLRQLGAQLPRVPLSALDAGVKVLVDPADSRTTEQLVWAFLRRGRAVLTGLPGGGKSTALAHLTANLADIGDTVPILVRLRDMESDDGSFSDRVLHQACKRVGPADADDLRALLANALAAGDATLVLDGLDETYNRRHQVVGELEEFLGTVSPDVDVILATRDVAYADAATLGWPDLRLAPPEDVDHLISGVLRLAASHQNLPAGRLDSWLATRHAWVTSSLHRDHSLRETPLLPTLLALLASEREEATLPSGRAHVLWEMVEAVVDRSERNRGSDHHVGTLNGVAASKALLNTYEVEASQLLSSDGPVPKSDIVDAVARQLGPGWSMADGPALVAAEEAVRFWDENGVFTVSGADELVTPRLELFSEIGAARQASRGDEDSISAWVTTTAGRQGYECLALAAGLNSVAADTLTMYAVNRGSSRDHHPLLMTAARAVQTGATVSTEVLDQLKGALLDDAIPGDKEGWESMTSVVQMLGPTHQARLSVAAEAFPTEHQRVIQALFALRHPEVITGELRRTTLLAVLETRHLPKLRDRFPTDSAHSLADLMADRSLAAAVTAAAHELADTDPEPILGMIGQVSFGVSMELSELMVQHGHAAAVSEIHRESNERLRATFASLGGMRDPYLELLDGLAAVEPVALERQQRRRLDELADLLETLRLNDASSTLKEGMHRGHGLDLAQLVMVLADLPKSVIATQARIVLDRIALFDDAHSPYFALFDLARPRQLTHWEKVDVDMALAMARDLLWGGLASAQVATQIYQHAPRSEAAIEALRDVVAEMEDQSPDHLMCAAICLSMQQEDFEPHWRRSPNPMLRRVVARWTSTLIDGEPNPTLLELLQDPDGTVRVEAVRNVAESSVPQREQLLQTVVDEGEPEFTCLHCRRVTPAGTRFCECSFGGAQPAAEAAKALAGSSDD
jgi:hypothetical protein